MVNHNPASVITINVSDTAKPMAKKSTKKRAIAKKPAKRAAKKK